MAEQNVQTTTRFRRLLRHRGRFSQIPIYLGKQLRFFINQSDWKVLPMAAIIAALVSMVIRKRFFLSMEGNLMGAFALTCVSIWNGCFNSIQSVCRERPIVKREHRSGMHITSYMAAHMIYQLMLCLLQTGLSVYVMILMGVQFPDQGFMTRWMVLDLGISMLLISYASDMMSLFVSSVSHTTTGAMTVMPFVLIFQLVFSGGILPLPEWSRPLSGLTVSSYGISAIAAQAGYNEAPMVTAWNTLYGLRDDEIGGTFTLGQLLELADSEAVQKRRDTKLLDTFTLGEAMDQIRQAADTLRTSEAAKELLEKDVGGGGVTLETALSVLDGINLSEEDRAKKVDVTLTLGDALDILRTSPILQAKKDEPITLAFTIGDLFDMVGEDKVKAMVEERTARASYNPSYERSVDNVVGNWLALCFFVLLFATLATISLELIDKDKR